MSRGILNYVIFRLISKKDDKKAGNARRKLLAYPSFSL